MNEKQTIAFAIWMLRRHAILGAMYKDRHQGFFKPSFSEFCMKVFKESKFFKGKPDAYENLIQIRVVVTSGVVENVFSNVQGTFFDVDIMDKDIQDEKMQEQIYADCKKLEYESNRIF